MSDYDLGTTQRASPYSMEAEKSVLGAMLMGRDPVARAVEIVASQMFYDPRHVRIFSAMSTLFERGVDIDPVGLFEELKQNGQDEAAGGLSYIGELMDVVATAASVEYHAKIVRERALVRDLITASEDIIKDAYRADGKPVNELLDEAESRIFQVAQSQDREGFVRIKDLLWPTFEAIEKLQEDDSPVTGVPSGYNDLDNMTTGLQPGDLVIVAARPSMGKTSWVMNVAANAAIEHRSPVAIFSLEMGKEQLVKRLLSAEGRIDAQRLRRGGMTAEDHKRLATAAGHLNTAPIYIDDTPGISVTEVRAKARRLVSEIQSEGGQLGMIVIDYLQLLSGGKAESRVQEVSQMSRGLKALAREVNVPVVALSQLSRAVEQRTDKRPMLSDLRESGSIEQDADLVMFLYRPEYYGVTQDEEGNSTEGLAELIVAKQRNGPVGRVKLFFHKAYTRFDSLARDRVGAGGNGGPGAPGGPGGSGGNGGFGSGGGPGYGGP